MRFKSIRHLSSFKGLSSNFIALSFGVSVQSIIQIVSLPLFLNQIGLNRYALWLFAYSLSQISGLLDFGSMASLQNSLSRFHFQKKFSEIDASVKQTINILILTSVLFLIFIYIFDNFGSHNLDLKLVTVFVISNLLQSFMGPLEAMSRIDNNVSLGLYIGNILRITEFVGTVIGIFTFQTSILKIAALGLLFKLSFFSFVIVKLSSKYRFVRFGWPNLSKIFFLLRNGFPFLVIKISDLVTISGLLIVLKGKMTSTEFVVFVAARTFFRIGLQITTLVAHTFGYGMSRCWVTSDIIGMKKLIQQSARITFCLSALGMGLYLFVGKAIFLLWIHKQISPDSFTIVFGACYAFLLSINQNQKTKFYAVNHASFVSFIQLSFSLGLVILVNYAGLEFKVASVFFILAVFELLNFMVVNLFTRNSLDQYFASTDQNFLPNE